MSSDSPLELVLLIGLQASGKSTFCKQHFYSTHIRINLDMLRTRHRERILFNACLAGKARTVIDNTNLTRAERAVYIQAARAAQYSVHGYFMQSRVEDCLRHNAERRVSARVPDLAIVSSSRRMQVPSYEEGFDRLFYVRKGEDGTFVTEAWTI